MSPAQRSPTPDRLVVTNLGADGSCIVAANQAGTAGYIVATEVRQTFTVFIAQVITFKSTPPSNPSIGNTYVVTATGGGSGKRVVISSLTPSICSMHSGTAKFLARGTCTIAANQAGTATYAPAAQLTQSVRIR